MFSHVTLYLRVNVYLNQNVLSYSACAEVSFFFGGISVFTLVLYESLQTAGLTGVISDVGVDRQPADVVGINHVGVPLPAVAGVMEDVVQCLRRHVLTHYSHLRHKQKVPDVTSCSNTLHVYMSENSASESSFQNQISVRTHLQTSFFMCL